MIIDCISDLHGYYPKLEGGDLLIVAGDLTARDEKDQIEYFFDWLNIQKYSKKIIISGNHDNRSYESPHSFIRKCLANGGTYLCDSGTEFEGLKIWGSPWTKTFTGMNPHCKAFTCDTEEELAEKFSLIPYDTNILITHCPPYGIFDTVRRYAQDVPESTGCNYLLKKVRGNMELKLHIFGHIHEHGGKNSSMNMIQFINASHVNEYYEPVNKPVRVIL